MKITNDMTSPLAT